MAIWTYKKRKVSNIAKEAFLAEGGYQSADGRGRLTVVERIDVGHGNKGLYIVDYRSAKENSGMSPFRMIKKYSISDLEFKFSQ